LRSSVTSLSHSPSLSAHPRLKSNPTCTGFFFSSACSSSAFSFCCILQHCIHMLLLSTRHCKTYTSLPPVFSPTFTTLLVPSLSSNSLQFSLTSASTKCIKQCSKKELMPVASRTFLDFFFFISLAALRTLPSQDSVGERTLKCMLTLVAHWGLLYCSMRFAHQGTWGVGVIYMEWGFGDECINDQKVAFLQYSSQLVADINNSTSLSLACCKQVHCCHVKGQQSKQVSNQKAVLASVSSAWRWAALSGSISSSQETGLRQHYPAALPSCPFNSKKPLLQMGWWLHLIHPDRNQLPQAPICLQALVQG